MAKPVPTQPSSPVPSTQFLTDAKPRDDVDLADDSLPTTVPGEIDIPNQPAQQPVTPACHVTASAPTPTVPEESDVGDSASVVAAPSGRDPNYFKFPGQVLLLQPCLLVVVIIYCKPFCWANNVFVPYLCYMYIIGFFPLFIIFCETTLFCSTRSFLLNAALISYPYACIYICTHIYGHADIDIVTDG